jgi:hypothetical protein
MLVQHPGGGPSLVLAGTASSLLREDFELDSVPGCRSQAVVIRPKLLTSSQDCSREMQGIRRLGAMVTSQLGREVEGLGGDWDPGEILTGKKVLKLAKELVIALPYGPDSALQAGQIIRGEHGRRLSFLGTKSLENGSAELLGALNQVNHDAGVQIDTRLD